MHTEIRRKISLNDINALFKHSKIIVIKSYSSVKQEYIFDKYKKEWFRITIRHGENQDPKQVFKKALKYFQLEKKLEILIDKHHQLGCLKELGDVKFSTRVKRIREIKNQMSELIKSLIIK